MDEKPSRNEDEYFAKQNLEIIRRMREERDAARREQATRQPLTCPRCHAALEEQRMQDVVVDSCPQCNGVWLDAGELEILREEGDRGGRSFLDSLFGSRGR